MAYAGLLTYLLSPHGPPSRLVFLVFVAWAWCESHVAGCVIPITLACIVLSAEVISQGVMETHDL